MKRLNFSQPCGSSESLDRSHWKAFICDGHNSTFLASSHYWSTLRDWNYSQWEAMLQNGGLLLIACVRVLLCLVVSWRLSHTRTQVPYVFQFLHNARWFDYISPRSKPLEQGVSTAWTSDDNSITLPWKVCSNRKFVADVPSLKDVCARKSVKSCFSGSFRRLELRNNEPGLNWKAHRQLWLGDSSNCWIYSQRVAIFRRWTSIHKKFWVADSFGNGGSWLN